jgi:hypothetical protein
MKYPLAYTKQRCMVPSWKFEHFVVDVLAKLEWQAKESWLRRGKGPDHGGPTTRNGCPLWRSVAGLISPISDELFLEQAKGWHAHKEWENKRSPTGLKRPSRCWKQRQCMTSESNPAAELDWMREIWGLREEPPWGA